jgi:hypothetical protein
MLLMLFLIPPALCFLFGCYCIYRAISISNDLLIYLHEHRGDLSNSFSIKHSIFGFNYPSANNLQIYSSLLIEDKKDDSTTVGFKHKYKKLLFLGAVSIFMSIVLLFLSLILMAIIS